MLSALLRLDVCCHGDAVYRSLVLKVMAQLIQSEGVNGNGPLLLLYGAFPLHGTVQSGSLLGGFLLGTVPGTWYFFSTTSAEVPSDPYRYQNVMCKLY